jgi:hypothetical protein
LSGSSYRAPLRAQPMENSLKSSSSLKISDNEMVQCGWRGYDGSCHGMESAIVYGTSCELPIPQRATLP